MQLLSSFGWTYAGIAEHLPTYKFQINLTNRAIRYEDLPVLTHY